MPGRVVDRYGDGRFSAARVDASDAAAVAELASANRCDAILNAVDPRFVMPIFEGAFEAGATYLDMAMSLSKPHPEQPHEEAGVKLGDEQFAGPPAWEERGLLALVGIGVEPGMSDVFARYAADELFETIDEIGVRDGANLDVEGYDVRAELLDLDHDRGVPQPPGGLGEGPRLVHDRAVQRARGLHVPRGDRPRRMRERRARGGAPRAAMDRLPARDVQVRAGRRVHRRAEDAPQARAWTAPSRSAWTGSRSRPATSSRPPCPTR